MLFQSFPKKCLRNSVNASSCLCRNRPLCQTVAVYIGVCHNRPLQDSVSAGDGLCLTRCLQNLRRAISYRHQFVQSPSNAQAAFVRDTVHHNQSKRDRFCKVWGGGILKNFKIFKKARSAGNCPKSAQNQTNLKNFNFKFYQNFQKKSILWAFQTIFSIFWFFENFENFGKFEYFFISLPKTRLRNSVNASFCLSQNRPLCHPVAAYIGVCHNRLLQDSVSASGGWNFGIQKF
jgi:hypothetical protein